MSHQYQYHERPGPYRSPNPEMASQPRRPPPDSYRPSGPQNRQQRPPPLRVQHPQGPPPGGRPLMRPPPQQYAEDPVESLYDGSAYGGAEEFDQWPLPSRPFAESGRNSPGGSPRGSPRGNGSPRGSPRRPPPQRPQRPDYQDPNMPMMEPPRQPPPRIAPADRAYRQPPPPHHGSGQWTGEGYRSAQPPPPPNRPPPQASPEEYHRQQAMQQAMRNQQRAPLGPPPSARRGPAFHYPPVAPVHPIAEETDSMRGSIRNASVAHSSYASSNAIPIGIPGYYLEHRGSGYSHPSAVMGGRPSVDAGRPSMDVSTVGRPSTDTYEYEILEPPEPMYQSERGSERSSPSPEPAALIRQASLGKKTKPTLTTVKSGERIRRESEQGQSAVASLPSQQPQPPERMREIAVPEPARVAPPPRVSRLSASSSEEGIERSGQEEKAMEAAAGSPTLSPGVYAMTKNKSRENLGNRTPSSDILSSGTGLLDSSSTESEHAPKKRRSKELLGAFLGKDRSRSRSRSPLSFIAAQRTSVAVSEKSAPSPHLENPGPAFSDAEVRRRPPKLDIDAVRDAEARGSLTSLPDLIRRATKLAGNLDRGKTASRLGMNFFDGLEDSPSANRRSDNVSDILGSFPQPGSPAGSRAQRGSFSNFSGLRRSHLPLGSDADEIRPKKGRRCCGLPVWGFVVLLVMVFLLVCAAVLVPVVLLIILPRMGDQPQERSVVAREAAVWLHGFDAPVPRCATVQVGLREAEVGDDIARLLSTQSNFGISLDGERLLDIIALNHLGCDDLDQLVTFTTSTSTSPHEELKARESTIIEDDETSSDEDGTLDFARLAVLFILQDSYDLGKTTVARKSLQEYFDSAPFGGNPVDLGNGYTCDLSTQTLRLPDGTVVGA